MRKKVIFLCIIEASNIKKSFEKNNIFENLNFSIQKGEIKAIVGPSGVGKSTLLKMLCGLLKVDDGNIKIDDEFLVKNGKYAKKSQKNKILNKIGVVFQNFNLFPNLTVFKNLLIVKNDKKKANTLIERFYLKDQKNLYPCNISGGQKQRVAIIRALMANPKILFFDEPTSSLDTKNIQEVAKLISEIKNSGKTILVVTHDKKLTEMLNCSMFKLSK